METTSDDYSHYNMNDDYDIKQRESVRGTSNNGITCKEENVIFNYNQDTNIKVERTSPVISTDLIKCEKPDDLSIKSENVCTSNNLQTEVKSENSCFAIFFPENIKKEVLSEDLESLDNDNSLLNSKDTHNNYCEDIDIKYEDIDDNEPQSVDKPSGVNDNQVEEHNTECQLCPPGGRDVKADISSDHKMLDGNLQHHLCKSSLTNHIKLCTNNTEKKFKCSLCDHRCEQRSHLMTHMKSHKSQLTAHEKIHTGQRNFHCPMCEYKFMKKGNLLSHLKTHYEEKRFRCHICDYKCIQKISLTRHIKTHTGVKDFQCHLCDFKCIQRCHLTTHIKTHTGEKNFKCDVCDYKCTQKISLTRHIKTHTGVKAFQCDLCEYRSIQKGHLTTHIKTHTGEKNFKCNVCDYKCIQKISLTRHIKTHSGLKTKKALRASKPAP